MQDKGSHFWDCYIVYPRLDESVLDDTDEICQQLYAEIKIMRTLEVRDIKDKRLQ